MLQQHQPKVVQLNPIEAAGQLYKIDQISQMRLSSFQVPRQNFTSYSYVLSNTENWEYLTNTFPFNSKGGKTYRRIVKTTAMIQLEKWYYKVCKSCKLGYNNSTNAPRRNCEISQPMPM
jgi:hypothetical protein